MFRRKWTTPLTIGCFIIMSVTGLLMFFHLDQGLNKLLHQWASWVFVAGVITHVLSNWATFPRYITTEPIGKALIVIAVIVLSLSFYSWGSEKDQPPSVLAMKMLVRAPISQLAPLVGKDSATLMSRFSTAGIAIQNEDATIESVAKGDKKIQGKAIKILFGVQK